MPGPSSQGWTDYDFIGLKKYEGVIISGVTTDIKKCRNAMADVLGLNNINFNGYGATGVLANNGVIPFGRAVVHSPANLNTSVGVKDTDAILPIAPSLVFRGFTVAEMVDPTSQDQYGSFGWGPQRPMAVMTRGEINLLTETAISAYSPIYFRTTPKGINVELGRIRADADSATTGTVSAIAVSTGGAGYTYSPLVTIGGNGVGAEAVATVSGGVVTAVTVINPGYGYSGTVFATLSGGGATTQGTLAVTVASASINTADLATSCISLEGGIAGSIIKVGINLI